VDADGNATHQTHLEASIQLEDVPDTSQPTTRDIIGDAYLIRASQDPNFTPYENKFDDITNESISRAIYLSRLAPQEKDDLFNPVLDYGRVIETDDTLSGSTGGDHLLAGGGRDYVFGGDGDDDIEAGSGSDYVEGDAGNDTIEGGSGADVIYGMDGDDKIFG